MDNDGNLDSKLVVCAFFAAVATLLGMLFGAILGMLLTEALNLNDSPFKWAVVGVCIIAVAAVLTFVVAKLAIKIAK